MEKLKNKFLNELDYDLCEAPGINFVADKCVEIALDYSKQLQSDKQTLLEALKELVEKKGLSSIWTEEEKIKINNLIKANT